MNKILLTIVLGIFFISFASANDYLISEDFTYKYGDPINLTVICVNDGYCSNTSICNVNVIEPSSGQLITNTTLQNQIFIHNTTIEPLELGRYKVGGYCLDGDYSKEIDYDIQVTPSGKPLDNLAYIISVIFIILLFVGLIKLNNKFNHEEREKLYKKLVTEFFKFRKDYKGTNLAYAIYYLIAYGMLKMIFVWYYLLLVIFIFLVNEMVLIFGVNVLRVLFAQLVKIVLFLGLPLIGVLFITIFLEIIRNLLDDVEQNLRGTYNG